VGFVFQAFNLIPSLTATENVMVPLRAAGEPRAKAIRRARHLLDRVGLSDQVDRRPSELSGGQQQRVAVARALALDPPVVLADEPTAHLDYIQVEEVLRVLRELAADDRVVIVSTHDQRLVPLADDIVELVPEVGRSTLPPERVELRAGEVLFHQGSWGERIFLVESGSIEIVGERIDGVEDHKALLGPGEYFGEMGPLYGIPRAATARAQSDSVVTGYTVRDFRARLQSGIGGPPAKRRRRQPAPT